jgi:hypothetical protein
VPFFCADFDDGNRAGVYVNGLFVDVGGQERIDDGGVLELDREARSPPWALSFAHPAVAATASGTQYTTMDRPVSMPVTGQTHLSFDMRIGTFTTGSADVMALGIKGAGGGETRASFELNETGGQLLLEVNSQSTASSKAMTFAPLPKGTWIHVDASLSLGSPNTSRVTVDVPGQSPLSVSNEKPPGFTGALTSWFILGVSVTVGSGAAQVTIDNVIFNQD